MPEAPEREVPDKIEKQKPAAPVPAKPDPAGKSAKPKDPKKTIDKRVPEADRLTAILFPYLDPKTLINTWSRKIET
jgi:hypothetical protein